MLILSLVIVFLWVLGSMLTLKMDAMFGDTATDWSQWWLSLIAWVPIGILMLTTKHKARFRYHPDDEFYY
jgi:hypothetical protein